MVFPVVGDHFPFKFLVIVFPIRQIVDFIASCVLSIKKARDTVDIVSVSLLEPRCWEGHCHDSICDVGDVEIVLVILKSVPLATHL